MTTTSLRSVALSMLKEARIRRCPGAYSATGHSRTNISILHQQVRCINLSWALVRTGQVKNGSVVGIVGGSFSALTLAVSLALQRRCIIYIYEKNERLLDQFRRSPYRYISTNLTSRDLPVYFRPATSAPIYDPPIFKWSEGIASEVAHRWLREFQMYYMRLPIFLRTTSEVTALGRDRSQNKVKLKVTTSGFPKRWDHVDIAIVSTGFGNERNSLDVQDWSYWQSGSPLQYRPGRRTKAKERVLISGCGDSGIVELMHYVFRDFEHEDMPDYFPSGRRIESYVQPALEQSDMWNIRYSAETPNFDGKVISELCWFYFAKDIRDRNPTFVRELSKGLTGNALKVHNLREELLVRTWRLLRKYGVSAASARDHFLLEREIASLSRVDQFAIRDKLNPHIANLASFELAERIGGMDLAKFVDLRPYQKRLLGRFEIWMNDNTPTIYNEKIAPVNLIFLKLCQSVEDIKFVPGRVQSIGTTARGYEATFKSRAKMQFERVATRFGARHDKISESMLGSAPRRMHFGDWLLDLPISIREITRNDGIVVRQRFDAAYEAVQQAARRFSLDGLSPQDKKSALPKLLYLGALLHSDMKVFRDDPILSAPEDWLRRRLERGSTVTYDQSNGVSL